MAEPQTSSGDSTPNARFSSQLPSAEDLLKEQTVGLVHLSDFRKRRAEALEQSSTQDGSGLNTLESRESTPNTATFKKKRKKDVRKGGLSFGDEEDDDEGSTTHATGTKPPSVSRSNTPGQCLAATDSERAAPDTTAPSKIKKRLKPNSGVVFAPKSQSKSALAREAQLKESLRKEYLQIQEAVKATEFILPFVFFDGKDTPGGKVRIKKGDPIWLFLERARKVGAEMTGTSGSATRKDWARISVDDLMIVKGDLILPPHYEFHYFILNRSSGYHGALFSQSSEPTSATPAELLGPTVSQLEAPIASDGLIRPGEDPKPSTADDDDLEGFSEKPALTKVVDRRWYERNKHIYPASIWEDFDPERDYSSGGRKDREGNQMFFSR